MFPDIEELLQRVPWGRRGHPLHLFSAHIVLRTSKKATVSGVKIPSGDQASLWRSEDPLAL